MNEKHHSLRTRLTALLLALICVLGLFPTTAFAAGDTITLKEFGHSGVAYESAALGRCTLHEMTFKNGNQTTTGFCGTKGGDMGNSLQGQTWGNKRSISDPTVETMMAYYYAHSTGVFTDEAIALGVNDVWNAGYRWYMNAWVQACIWRCQQGSMSDPVAACADGSLQFPGRNSLHQHRPEAGGNLLPGPDAVYPGSGQPGRLGQVRCV